jgi:hypothetical protein
LENIAITNIQQRNCCHSFHDSIVLSAMFTKKKNKTITWIDKLQLEVLVIWRNFNRVAGEEQR